jgi:hypothetical protein
MSKNTLLSNLINYISANSSGNVVVAAPTSGLALDVNGTGRFTGALTLGSTITNGTFTYTLPSATGTLALTSALGSYLPLSGGTLTGALGGTSATFSGSLEAGKTGGAVTSGDLLIDPTSLSPNVYVGRLSSTSNDNTNFIVRNRIGTELFKVTGNTGAATFSGRVLAGNSMFLGEVISGFSTIESTSGNGIWLRPAGASSPTGLRITTTGAATFSSSVSARTSINLVHSNGTTVAKIEEFSGTQGVGLSLFNSSGTQNVLFNAGGDSFIRGGNVGIGTTAPGTPLHIIRALGNDCIAIGESGSNQRLRIGQESSYTGNYINSTNIDLKLITYRDGGSGGSMMFYTSTDSTPNERMRITSGGTAIFKGGNLDDLNTTAIRVDNRKFLTFYNAADTGWAFGLVADSSNNGALIANNNMIFASGTSAAERMRLTSGGNVAIGGTNDYSSRLTVEKGDSSQASPHFHLSNTVGYGGFHFLDGTSYYIGQNSNFRSLRMYSGGSTGTGVNLAAGATSWGTYSDERMKTDLVAIENATEKVSQLRSMIGRYKTDEQTKRRSFLIAQDVKEVLPEAIGEDLNTGMLEIRYSEVIPLLVASIKELKTELEILKNK